MVYGGRVGVDKGLFLSCGHVFFDAGTHCFLTRNCRQLVGLSKHESGDKSHVHLRKSINQLLLTQQNLLHECFTMTGMTKSCSNFRSPKAID